MLFEAFFLRKQERWPNQPKLKRCSTNTGSYVPSALSKEATRGATNKIPTVPSQMNIALFPKGVSHSAF